jgi:Prokaryotic membrane lipoprotein lipid attachment site
MKRILLAMIAALTLSGCNIPDLDVAAYHSRSSTSDGAITANATATAQPPKSKYDADQPAENTGDYSSYF